MKILLVSIASPHFFRWVEQLNGSGHDLYWLNVRDSGKKINRLEFVEQIYGWRYRINFPKRYWIKKNCPNLNSFINIFNERDVTKLFEKKLEEIKPDVVHSFVMYLAAAPFLKVMKRNPSIKWVYSSWGSDLFYYSNVAKEEENIKNTLPFINYLFTDCHRDYRIAQKFGFKGQFLGAFPGGGGYDLEALEVKSKAFNERNLILVKGYQGNHGKCIEILRAILKFKSHLKDNQIVVFGADEEVFKFVQLSELFVWENFKCFGKIAHHEVLDLMGRSFLYIGNSTSDGMPNTLLEAIIMGAFPIQSNPGGASGEIINDGFNGLLIENPKDTKEIEQKLKICFTGEIDLEKGVLYNLKHLKPLLDRKIIQKQVLEKYLLIKQELIC